MAILRLPLIILAGASAYAAGHWLGSRTPGMGWPFARYIVDGPSMEPTYHAGDRLLVNRVAYLRDRPATGDIVVVRDPEDGRRLLIKRIALSPNGASELWVLGDNLEASRDSRSFGPVAKSTVIGKALFRY